MKKFSALLLALLFVLSLASCAGENLYAQTDGTQATDGTADAAPAEKTKISVSALKGPTGMGMAKLMSDNDEEICANEYAFTIESAPDSVTAKVIGGDVDIASVPVNLASVLYNKTNGEYVVATVNTLGVLYVIENGNSVNSVADLKGKSIVSSGQASTPEYIFNYILEKNGLNPDDDMEIDYKTEHSEVITALTSGGATVGVAPEPNVSIALASDENLRVALDLTDEWDKISDGCTLIQGCIIVKKEFADANPDALSAFLDEYKASVEFVNSNVDDASLLIERYGIVPKAAIAKRAIPNCNIVFIEGDEMKTNLENFLAILLSANPASVGGTLPDEEFYYTR